MTPASGAAEPAEGARANPAAPRTEEESRQGGRIGETNEPPTREKAGSNEPKRRDLPRVVPPWTKAAPQCGLGRQRAPLQTDEMVVGCRPAGTVPRRHGILAESTVRVPGLHLEDEQPLPAPERTAAHLGALVRHPGNLREVVERTDPDPSRVATGLGPRNRSRTHPGGMEHLGDAEESLGSRGLPELR